MAILNEVRGSSPSRCQMMREKPGDGRKCHQPTPDPRQSPEYGFLGSHRWENKAQRIVSCQKTSK
jgi:hypothetical protein